MEIKQINVLGQTYDIKDAFARALVANEYNTSSSYSEGDLCIYDDNLYKCLSGTTGSWNSNAWSQTTIVDNLEGGGSGYNFDITQDEWDTIVAINNQTISGILSLSGVTKVASYMFQSCASLEGVDFPNCSVIDTGAFTNCTSLQSVNFPNCTLVSNPAFYGCISLQSADFPVCKTIGNYAFYNCQSLQSVNFPICTTIGASAFYGCTSLQSANFPNCKTIQNYAFSNCTSLQSADFPVCKTIGSYAFYNCKSLQSINFPVCTIINLWTFYVCTSLQSVDFPNCTTISSSAFYYCTSLQSASFPVCTSIGNSAFYGCSSLSALYLLGSFVCALSTPDVFFETPMSKSSYIGTFGSIYVPSSLVASYKTASYWEYYSDRIVGV